MTAPTLNYLNVLAYIANVIVTFGGNSGIGGLPTNSELSEKYQTLVTPVGWAFSIWGVIFISQLIFTVVQLFAPFRAAPLVVNGVGNKYLWTVVAQIAWTLVFSLEVIWLSLIAMLCILFFLFKIVVMQYKIQDDVGLKGFWLLKFPFSIHCGWILAASFVNLSVVLVKYGLGANIQFYTALGSLICILLIAAVSLTYPTRAEYVIPSVLCWATHGIYFELSNPKDLILSTFSENQISMAKNGSLITAIVILGSVIIRGIRSFWNRKAKNNSGASDSNEGYNENTYLRTDDAGKVAS